MDASERTVGDGARDVAVGFRGAGYARIPADVSGRSPDGSTRPKKRGKADTCKVLLPIRPRRNKARSALDTSGLVSTIFLSFLTPFYWNARRGGNTTETLTPLMSDREASAVNCDRLETLWQGELDQKGKENAQLKNAVFKFAKTRFLMSALFTAISASSGFLLSAYLIYRAITYLESAEESVGYCFALALALFLSVVVRVLGSNLAVYLNARSAIRMRCAVMLLLYRKVTRLRTSSQLSVGEVVNICANDFQRLHDAIMHGPMLFSLLPLVVAIISGVVMLIGAIPTLVAVATLVVFFTIQTFLAKLNVRLRQKCVGVTDRRARLMNEVLSCIKLIKMYGWEESFAKKLADIRKSERRYLLRTGILQCCTLGLSLTTGPAIVFTSVMTYTLLGNTITAAQAFTLLQLYGSLTVTLYILPIALKPISESIVALRRVKPILLMDETSRKWGVPSDPGVAVEIAGAYCSWDAPPGTDNAGGDGVAGGEVAASGGGGSGGTGPRGPHERAGSRYRRVAEDEEKEKEEEEKVEREDEEAAITDDMLAGGANSHTASSPTLKGISLTVRSSTLVGICGSVGSGKSSLLNTLLDQLTILQGKVAVKGTFAYAAQQAWITNATVRENILFGKPYDEARYKKTVYSCCLERDLQIMADGDRTEIGERGVNVSGGQKQRISLARAYYSDRDVYLLDDPLSAVDAHVGKHIFTHCIRGALGGKTVLFVSHQLQYLSDCDHVVLMRDGRIAEQGTHDRLLSAGGEYARLLDTFHGRGGDDEEDVNDAIPEARQDSKDSGVDGRTEGPPRDDPSEHGGDENENIEERVETEVAKLIGDENQGHGTVAYATYRSFVQFTGSRLWAYLIPLLMFTTMLSSVGTNVWLSIWIQSSTVWTSQNQTSAGSTEDDAGLIGSLMNNSYEDTTEYSAYDYSGDDAESTTTGIAGLLPKDLRFFMAVYTGFFLCTYACIFISSVVSITTILRATTRIHDCLLRKIMRCPMSFFDTTPLGRILNRFTKDMDEVDLLLPTNLQQCLLFLSCALIVQFLFVLVYPLYLPILALALLGCGAVYLLFRTGYCQIKRLEHTSRSKVVSHLSATLQGLTTVKAYGQGRRFTAEFEKVLDTNSLFMELFTMAPRWTGARVDLISACLFLALGTLILVFKKSLLSPAVAAMAIQQAISISGGLLPALLRSSTETESTFLSVERMLEYIQQSPSEAEAHVEATKPGDDWPDKGELRLQEVEMRYRPGLPLVLKGITCHISPREKIGVVGRTGSGKSSLGVSLFRLVENVSGRILLDGVDVATVGLHDLRSRLSIIPQDPVLFAGTVRFNLDPLGVHSDEELWNALEKTYVKQTVRGLDCKLEAPVLENGENFSVGERQLMCMARALLRNSKVLLMDEATAAIDTETDSLIQQTIREAFKDCTMLIIAHRLNTVLDCDKIMLLDCGAIAEFDKPEVLRANPNSLFSGMLDAAQHNKGSLD